MCAMNPRLLRPLATGFNPRSIAGLVGWWDASDASTITLNSGRVSEWANKVASGPDFTQANAAWQPLYVGGGRAGKNVIQMDDTTRRLGNATAIDIGFFAAVLAPTGTQNYGSTLSFANRHGLLRNLTTENLFANNFSLFPAASYRRNGVATSLYGTDWAVFTNGGTTTSIAPKLDVDGIGSVRSTYTIAEVLMYSQQPSQQQQERIQGYLAWRWGLQAQLPSNHPYAYSFPGFGSQARPDNGDALAWESAVYSNSGSVSVGTLAAVNTFANAIDAASLRDRFYRLNLFAGNGLNAALVPLYRGPTYGGTTYGNATDTNNGPFVSGDYTLAGGLNANGSAGSSSKYLDTGLAPDDLPALDSVHMAAWKGAGSVGATTIAFIGSRTATQFWYVRQNAATDYLAGNVGFGVFATGASADTTAGLVTITRDTSGLVLYKDTTSVATDGARTPTANANDFTVYTFRNTDGTVTANIAWPYAMYGYSIGVNLSSADVTAYHTAFAAFNTAMGRS